MENVMQVFTHVENLKINPTIQHSGEGVVDCRDGASWNVHRGHSISEAYCVLRNITSKFDTMENLEEMREKVFNAADIIAEGKCTSREEALNQMGVSPQCGFASHSSGNNIDETGMINKLKLVRKLAEGIWPGEP